MILTEQEKELKAKYELEDKDILAIRRQLAIDDIRGARAKAQAAEEAAAALAAQHEEEEGEEEGDFGIQ